MKQNSIIILIVAIILVGLLVISGISHLGLSFNQDDSTNGNNDVQHTSIQNNENNHQSENIIESDSNQDQKEEIEISYDNSPSEESTTDNQE